MTELRPNVIFLDMDGVICTPRANVAVNQHGLWGYLDPIACRLVRRLADECQCKIVISSSWRVGMEKYAMHSILNATDGSLGALMHENWRTDEEGKNRGAEIQRWLDANEHNQFVILDDDSDMGALLPRLIKTDVYDGFGFRDYERAKALFRGLADPFPPVPQRVAA